MFAMIIILKYYICFIHII